MICHVGLVTHMIYNSHTVNNIMYVKFSTRAAGEGCLKFYGNCPARHGSARSADSAHVNVEFRPF